MVTQTGWPHSGQHYQAVPVLAEAMIKRIVAGGYAEEQLATAQNFFNLICQRLRHNGLLKQERIFSHAIGEDGIASIPGDEEDLDVGTQCGQMLRKRGAVQPRHDDISDHQMTRAGMLLH